MRICVLLLVVLFYSCKKEAPQSVLATTSIEKVTQQSELEVYNFDGLEKFLHTDTDNIYVINFWATWCAPCIKELPFFEQLNAEYANERVKVILVSLDFPNKYESQLKPFIIEKRLKSKVIALNDVDSNTWIPKINENWSGAIPATLIYNKHKRQFYERSFTFKELETEVKQFIN